MDVRDVVMHNFIVMHTFPFLLIFFVTSIIAVSSHGASEIETKKTYIEDIFIWRMSDELKLTANEEKKFSEIQKTLNKKKAELNKEIQEATQSFGEISSAEAEATANSAVSAPSSTVGLQSLDAKLKKLRRNIKDYNQISLDEFDAMKKLLGTKRFSSYLQIKSDLTSKVKSLLSEDKNVEKPKDLMAPKLPPPTIIIEKNE